MPGGRLFFLTAVAMTAFAANSLLCRSALLQTPIDAGLFSLLRLASGAAALSLLCFVRQRKMAVAGGWLPAAMLVMYVFCFSYSYRALSAGIGALLLFGAVQLVMILFGMIRYRERLRPLQWTGALAASIGLVFLLLPGNNTPSAHGAVLMLLAGGAWGGYSLLGKKNGPPVEETAGNFLRGSALAIVAVLAIERGNAWHVPATGIGYAVVSGALTSGLGYAIWYAVLPHLSAASAALLQLTVPVIAALGGTVLLGESVTVRFMVSSIVILGGVALASLSRRHRGTGGCG